MSPHGDCVWFSLLHGKFWNFQPFVSAGSNSNQRGGDDTDDQSLLTPASREKPLKGIPIPAASLSCLPRVPSESWSGTISMSQPVLFHTASTTCWGRAWGFNSTNRTFQTSLVPSPDPAQGIQSLSTHPFGFPSFSHLNPSGCCSSALSWDRFQLLRFVIPSTPHPFGLGFPWAGPSCCTSDPGRNWRGGFFSIPPCKCVKKSLGKVQPSNQC